MSDHEISSGELCVTGTIKFSYVVRTSDHRAFEPYELRMLRELIETDPIGWFIDYYLGCDPDSVAEADVCGSCHGEGCEVCEKTGALPLRGTFFRMIELSMRDAGSVAVDQRVNVLESLADAQQPPNSTGTELP